MSADKTPISLREQVDLTARMKAAKARQEAEMLRAGNQYKRQEHKPSQEQQEAIDGLAAALKTPDVVALLTGDAGTGKTWTLQKAAARSGLGKIDKFGLRTPDDARQPMPDSYAQAWARAFPGEAPGDTVIVSAARGLVVATPTHKAAAVLERKGGMSPITLASLTRNGQKKTPLGREVEAWVMTGMPGEPPCAIPSRVWHADRDEAVKVAKTLLKSMDPLEVAEDLLCIPHSKLYAYEGRLFLPHAALIVDEGSMVQGTMLWLLHEMFGLGLVIAGDPKQLPPVVTEDSPSDCEHSLLDYAADTPHAFTLTQIMRQSDEPATSLFEAARELYDHPFAVRSLPEVPLAIVTAQGLTPQELHEGLAPEAGTSARVFTPIICAQRRTVAETNRHLMEALGFEGLEPGLPVIAEVAGGKMSAEMLVALAHLVDDSRSGFAGANVAQYSAVYANSLWRVMAVVETPHGTAARLRSLDASGPDVVQFVRFKGCAGSGRAITVGFASTAHAMQGDEAPVALLHAGSLISAPLRDPNAQRSWLYVALTRGRYAAAAVRALRHDGRAHHLGSMYGALPHLTDEALGLRPRY